MSLLFGIFPQANGNYDVRCEIFLPEPRQNVSIIFIGNIIATLCRNRRRNTFRLQYFTYTQVQSLIQQVSVIEFYRELRRDVACTVDKQASTYVPRRALVHGPEILFPQGTREVNTIQWSFNARLELLGGPGHESGNGVGSLLSLNVIAGGK